MSSQVTCAKALADPLSAEGVTYGMAAYDGDGTIDDEMPELDPCDPYQP